MRIMFCISVNFEEDILQNEYFFKSINVSFSYCHWKI